MIVMDGWPTGRAKVYSAAQPRQPHFLIGLKRFVNYMNVADLLIHPSVTGQQQCEMGLLEER